MLILCALHRIGVSAFQSILPQTRYAGMLHCATFKLLAALVKRNLRKYVYLYVSCRFTHFLDFYCNFACRKLNVYILFYFPTMFQILCLQNVSQLPFVDLKSCVI